MSGWASLSGYLYVKPGGGGLSILKTRRRLWCVLEESQGRLIYFKSEDDSRSKPPLGYVELRGAAITLDMDNQNQFVIIVDGKEVILTAENHESMMIWLMALQARRDQFALGDKSRSSSSSTENDFELDHNFMVAMESRERSASELGITRDRNMINIVPQAPQRHHRPLEATLSLQAKGQGATVGFLGMSPEWRREQLKRMGETIDTSHPSVKILEKDRSRSLPPLLEESSLGFLNAGSRQASMSMEISERLQLANQQPSSHAPAWSSNSSTSTDTGDELNLEVGHRLLKKTSGIRNSALLRARSGSLQVEVGCNTKPNDGEKLTDLEKELMATKCELAKVLNRQTCLDEILKQKDEIIEDLDEKLGSKTISHETYDSKRRMSAVNKDYQERVRVLQNQNRFLNEEVRRLAKLRSQEHEKIKVQESKVRSLEADIEVWKLEYISLIQSSIRFTGTDTMDDAELSLFGGDRHKHRILSLLEEARKINPSLPTYEHLASGEVHVDCYGFKHHFADDGLLLHYLCQELSQHFLCQASAYEKHQKNWVMFLKNKSKNLMANKKDLKALVRAGIPDSHRRQMWRTFVLAQVEHIIMEKGAHYFRSLCSAVPDSPYAARYRKQISLDLMRTMPSNVKFSTPGSKGIMDLQDILLAFCIHNPTVGYCQGMNFLVAMALLFMDAQDAFWTLVAVTEQYHSPSYFDHNLLGAQADQLVLRDLMTEKMPELAKHLDAIDIEISTVTLNWFLAIFFDAVPFHTLLRIWDCFLLEGPKILFRFSLAILHIHSKEIILKCDTISVMRHLKTCAKISYDIDGLVWTSFKTLKPFPRRQDIVTKQICYLNALKEKYRWRDLQRQAFAERENCYLNMEAEADNYTGFECCVITKPGEAWVAYGEPPSAKICIVDCREQTMTDTKIKFDTRVMSMVVANTDMVLIGTLSWIIYAYNQYTREMCWQQRVHDAVLSMQVFEDDQEHSHRLFAGLADGTVAVFETISLTCSNYDLLYLPIGQSPVTCLKLLGNQLWCACGNTVSIIHASTLDPMDRFTVSGNPYDTVLSLVPGLPGVWISVRGSSVLELWDPMSLSCKMLYDTRTGRYPNLRKEDDTFFNAARITSILAMDYSVWVGTGEGTLITFDVFTQNQRTPSDTSPFLTEKVLVGSDMDSESWKSSVSLAQMSDCESYARLLEVERRVKDLYIQRLTSDSKLDHETVIDPGIEESGNTSVERDQKLKKDEAARLKLREHDRWKEEETSRRRSAENKESASSKSKDNLAQDFTASGDIIDKSLTMTEGSKLSVCKTISADSAKTDSSDRTELSNRTDLSASTMTSSAPSDLSCDDVTGNMYESFSLQDSGFTQTSARSSGSSNCRNNLASETLKQNTSHEDFQTSLHASSTSTFVPCTQELRNSIVADSFNGDMEKLVPSEQNRLPISDTECSQSEGIDGTDFIGNSSYEEHNVKEGKSRTKKKSEDSGISLLCEKNLDDTIYYENDKTFYIDQKPSSEYACLENNNHQQAFDMDELHNLKNKMQEASLAEISSGSSINTNKLCENSHQAEQKFDLNDDDFNGVELDKNSTALNFDGRRKSQDSNKTFGSDDVFPDAQMQEEFPAQDFSSSDHGKEQPVSSFDSDGTLIFTDSNNSSIDHSIKHDIVMENISNGVYLNGDISGSDLSEEECEKLRSETLDTISDQQLLAQTAKVKSITARFEAKASQKDYECATLKVRRSQSLKMNFKPSILPKPKSNKYVLQGAIMHLAESETETDIENETLDPKSPDLITSPNSLEHANLNVVNVTSSGPLALPPEDSTFSAASSDPSNSVKDHHAVQMLSGNTADKSEIQAAAMQLGKELDMSKPLITSKTSPSTLPSFNLEQIADSNQVKTCSKVKSTPQLQMLSTPEIDTRFYGDSDEDSCIHEARVQSFKDSYKRLAAATAKSRAPGDSVQESVPISSEDNSTATVATASVLKGTNESKATTDSSNFTPDSDNASRKSSTSGLSSIFSALSKKMSLSNIGRQSSDASIVFGNVQSHDPDAQWRLDYTNIHVDTDRESLAMSSASGGEGDSQPPSRRLSCVSTSSDMKDQRLNQFLRDTANTFNSQLGFPLEDEKQMMDFLSTPTLSGDNDGSATWSSYDEISTPSQVNIPGSKSGQAHLRLTPSSVYSVDSRTSMASTLDMFYGADLSLLSKNKISDKPVKWLVATERMIRSSMQLESHPS